jgi:hypothetical protein
VSTRPTAVCSAVEVGWQIPLDRGITRIHWLVGRAEDAELPEELVAPARHFIDL